MKILNLSLSKWFVTSLILLASSPVWATQQFNLITSLGPEVVQNPSYSAYTYYVRVDNLNCASAPTDYQLVPKSGNVQIQVSTDSSCTSADAGFQVIYYYAPSEYKTEFFRASFKAVNDTVSYQPWELSQTVQTSPGFTINPTYILGSEYNAVIVPFSED